MKRTIYTLIRKFYSGLKEIPSVIWFVLFSGLVLRIFGIWHVEQNDEFNEVFEAIKVASGKLNIYRWNKKGFIYILAGEYGIYFIISWLLGIYSSIADFAHKIVRDMTPLFIIGRTTSAVFGTVIIFFTYKIGEQFKKNTGLISAIFLTPVTVHVVHSHLVLVDITMTLSLVIALWFITRFYVDPKLSNYFGAGFFTGYAIIAKIPAVFLILPFITAHFFVWYNSNEHFKRLFINNKLFLYISGGFSGSIVCNPALLIALPNFIHYLLHIFGAHQGQEDQIPLQINGFWFYFNSMVMNAGPFVVILSIIGSLKSIFKFQQKELILASFIIPFFVFMSLSKWYVLDRYLIPIYPFLSILAASITVDFYNKINYRIIKNYYFQTLIILIIIAIPLFFSIKFNVSLIEKNTRYWAKDWIEKNIPANSKILIDAGRTINTYSPPLAQNEANLLAMIEKIKNTPDGETFDDSKIVDSESSVYFELLLKTLPDITYDLTTTERGFKVADLDYYINNGYQYVITSSNSTWRFELPEWKNEFPKSSAFYERVKTDCSLIKSFEPSTYRMGPIINIYSIKENLTN